MKSSSRRSALALRQAFASDPVCFSCRRSLQHRLYASAAATAEPVGTDADSVSSTTAISNEQSSLPRPTYQLQAGIVLSRPPIITRDLTPFEKAFFLYQRRLNERLALPFTRYFYFKKKTPADLDWKRKIKTRLTAARDIGIYNAYGKEGWNDELLVGATESEPEVQIEALLKDAETPDTEEENAVLVEAAAGGQTGSDNVQDGGDRELATPGAIPKKEEVEQPMPRITEADTTGNEKSLDRHLQHSLYLLVKGADGRWTFPSATLLGKETLQQAAERVILEAGGPNMNTWVVGNAPVGHLAEQFDEPVDNVEKGTKELGCKVFFMKGRIMAGQANLKDNKLGLQDYKWLSKEEIEKLVSEKYWHTISNMLADR